MVLEMKLWEFEITSVTHRCQVDLVDLFCSQLYVGFGDP